ncbi:DEAD/DEAH box helicase [Corticicoccus populi]|uniref:DEAD/DEAH box helicase n=1 Tax=Corticicoccus populi TaxID=1812821 RepID=A0ABW5WSI8_9STAP
MSQAFKRFKFDDNMLSAIESIHFTHPTLVQERVIPRISRGENVVVQSETGSGKSHAFLLPLIYQINTEINDPQAVILAPTRELAKQLHDMAVQVAGQYKDINISLFIGGTDFKRDIERAKKNPQIVIGTPTRIKELMNENVLNVHKAKSIVIDEADLMIDLGFLNDIDRLASAIGGTAQILVFSATIPGPLQAFLGKYIGDSETIVIEQPKNKASIHYSLIPVKGHGKEEKVSQLIDTLNPYIGLIFANSKERADALFDYLNNKGVKVGLFHGGLKPRERTKEIKKIRDLEYEWVVASDLAARGLDIDGASHVINYDIPKDIEFFTHRVGRVGRGQYEGFALTLYTPDEHHLVDSLESKGYSFSHEDIRRGELSPIKERTKRAVRKNQDSNIEKDLAYKVRKPKKVRPGYKKKMASQLSELKRDAKRTHSKARKKKRK